jgi:CDGSH-type Zn-finger protein
MKEPKVAKQGPYVLEIEAGRYSWCTCGYAAKDPYCDNAHRNIAGNFRSLKIEIADSQTVAFCGCKRTKSPPFCDGSHQLSPSSGS